MSTRITVERDGHVLMIGINRPEKRNAFDLESLDALATPPVSWRRWVMQMCVTMLKGSLIGSTLNCQSRVSTDIKLAGKLIPYIMLERSPLAWQSARTRQQVVHRRDRLLAREAHR